MAKLEFNPKLVGQAETNWWIAHNNKDKSKMLLHLSEQLSLLYGLSEVETTQALSYLAQAIKHHDDRTLDQAHQAIGNYYTIIKDVTGLTFDPQAVGDLELAWWDIHDELEDNPDKSLLAQAFTRLYAQQFNIDKEKLVTAGTIRAKATLEHDLAETDGITPEQSRTHWHNTEQLLIEFYSELFNVIDISRV